MSSSIAQKPAPIAESATPPGESLSDKAHVPDGGVLSKITKGGITPMMAQFLGIKADYPDSLLF